MTYPIGWLEPDNGSREDCNHRRDSATYAQATRLSRAAGARLEERLAGGNSAC